SRSFGCVTAACAPRPPDARTRAARWPTARPTPPGSSARYTCAPTHSPTEHARRALRSPCIGHGQNTTRSSWNYHRERGHRARLTRSATQRGSARDSPFLLSRARDHPIPLARQLDPRLVSRGRRVLGTDGARTAYRNLWLSTFSEHIGFPICT